MEVVEFITKIITYLPILCVDIVMTVCSVLLVTPILLGSAVTRSRSPCLILMMRTDLSATSAHFLPMIHLATCMAFGVKCRAIFWCVLCTVPRPEKQFTPNNKSDGADTDRVNRGSSTQILKENDVFHRLFSNRFSCLVSSVNLLDLALSQMTFPRKKTLIHIPKMGSRVLKPAELF